MVFLQLIFCLISLPAFAEDSWWDRFWDFESSDRSAEEAATDVRVVEESDRVVEEERVLDTSDQPRVITPEYKTKCIDANVLHECDTLFDLCNFTDCGADKYCLNTYAPDKSILSGSCVTPDADSKVQSCYQDKIIRTDFTINGVYSSVEEACPPTAPYCTLQNNTPTCVATQPVTTCADSDSSNVAALQAWQASIQPEYENGPLKSTLVPSDPATVAARASSISASVVTFNNQEYPDTCKDSAFLVETVCKNSEKSTVGILCTLFDPLASCEMQNGKGYCNIPDADGDGVSDSQDNCPTKANPDQAESDGDGLADACDNCPNVFNIEQNDADQNGVGDICEGSCEPLSNVTQLTVGFSSSCGLHSNGTATCWGRNDFGQLGDGTDEPTRVAVGVKEITSIKAIESLHNRTCVVREDGFLSCWGLNAVGKPYGMASFFQPVTIPGLADISAVTGEIDQTCVLGKNGNAWCWGNNPYGQLGNGTTQSSELPVPVTLSEYPAAIDSGAKHMCSLLPSGTAQCWGWNYHGQLGNGVMGLGSDSAIPVPVKNLQNVSMIRTGSFHSCALTKNGQVFCWGRNNNGELGNGTIQTSAVPFQVPGIENAVALSAGSAHTCAVLKDGTARCWGNNIYGQLGNGTQTNTLKPVAVKHLTQAVAIEAGYGHTCARLKNGSVLCWGNNYIGTLGNGIISQYGLTPTPVMKLKPDVTIDPNSPNVCQGK